ncbi:MAG: hypothetical protein DWQ07_10330 [Chloroflexi bacterium]|nr:MAG: hypothetical protein DWQ07_10330 [Chloroflexota bacterium]MBL1192892.1 hypothetical protein [Chloroflexota bacterium]NOH10184.1 hypothetical protein [Chloroflexota bacterium]
MKILLLDMDGVLLTPQGYHKALQETVRLLAQTLGFGDKTLSDEDIAAFEAVGITNEWDSSAISTALMLMEVWRHDSQATYPSAINSDSIANHALKFPEFAPFFQIMESTRANSSAPLERAQEAMTNLSQAVSTENQSRLLEILLNAHNIDQALSKRVFQELVLGSQKYSEIYKRESVLDTDSYLLKHDRSNIPAELHKRLLKWLKVKNQHAVIFTNRPSLFPNCNSGEPEAEIGAKLVGLEQLPYVAFGGLTWLAGELGMSNQELIKPSPVHALAAMRMALGDEIESALMAGAKLVHDGSDDGKWQVLDGFEVSVFEDSIGGVLSLKAAQKVLNAHGVKINTKAYGISQAKTKQAALSQQGAEVYPTFCEGLLQVL